MPRLPPPNSTRRQHETNTKTNSREGDWPSTLEYKLTLPRVWVRLALCQKGSQPGFCYLFFHFQTSKDWIYAFDGQGRHLLTLTADTSLITIVGWDNTTIRKPIARTKQRVHGHLTPCACVLPGILCAHHVLKDMTNQKQVGRNYYWHRIRIILWRFC